jgi:hypothetical protein
MPIWADDPTPAGMSIASKFYAAHSSHHSGALPLMTAITPLKSEVRTIAQLFADAHYVPAAVQRDYQWEERECELLLADLDRAYRPALPTTASVTAATPEESDDGIEADLRPDESPSAETHVPDYYLGAVIIRRLADGRVEIFDGLQRLTTLTVLLAVLRDTCKGDRKERLQRFIASEGGPRLTLSGKDRTLLDEIQLPGEATKARRGLPRSELARRIRAAARSFRREVMSWEDARRDGFVDFLLARVSIVIVEAVDPKLARQIFVTTNLRGVPLDQVALFKGQLIDIAPDETTAADMVRHWAGIQLAVGKDIDGFLLAIDFIERRAPQGADCLTMLADHLTAKPGPHGILNWTGRLAMYAGAWRELMQKLETPRSEPMDKSIWRLRFFKWSEWKPLALLWYADAFAKRARGNASGIEALSARRFEALHRRCMAIALAGYSDGDRSTIFGRAIQEVLRRRDPLNGALTFNELAQTRMKETLTRPLLHEENRLTLIRWLEAAQWTDPPAYIAGATVEHILPQRPAPNSQWMSSFKDEAERFDACHSLGNLAAMDYKENKDSENFDFAQKKPTIKAQSAKYRTLVDVANAQDWSPSDIEGRSGKLIAAVWRELKLPVRL